MHLTPAFPVVLALSAAPVSADVCVGNGADSRMLFAAEGDEGARLTAWLDPGDRLCAPGKGAGRVSVFEGADSIEGCTRLVGRGRTEVLLRYAAFDRCLWQTRPSEN